jgi:predicted dehydrogenases and related proteins
LIFCNLAEFVIIYISSQLQYLIKKGGIHMKQLNWATLGCGVIANELAQALSKEGRTLYSVANRTHEKAQAFAQKYGISKVYDNIDDVFYDPDVDIIYISTPHNTHINYLRKALSNGKHVLCEKSITLNITELDEAISLAKANNVILAEAMTIYHMPVYKKLNKIIASGQLGRLNLIQVNFGSYKDYNMTNRFFSRKLAGGALLDIGVYSLSLIRWFFKETPSHVLSQVRYAPTGVDEQAGILLMNDAAEMATVTLSLHSKQPKRATLSFDKAYVEIFEYPRGMQATITYTENGHKEVIDAGDTSDALYYEVCDMEKAINSASSDEIENLIHSQYTYDVMKIMSDIRTEWGMKYPEEE